MIKHINHILDSKIFFELRSFSFFWFAGFVISLFYILKFAIGFNGEFLEWTTYFSIFFFILLYFLIHNFVSAQYLKYFFFFFSIPFYSYFFLHYQFEYFHILLLVISLIFIRFENPELFTSIHVLRILDKFIIYFIIFFFTTKLFYWLDANFLISYQVSDLSKHVFYARQIEIIVPIIFFIVFFSSVFFILFSLKKTK